jgi:dCMP deaminase
MSDYSNCIATHGESNALRNTRPEDRAGSTIYINHPPCPGCQTLMKSLDVARIVFPEGNCEGHTSRTHPYHQ